MVLGLPAGQEWLIVLLLVLVFAGAGSAPNTGTLLQRAFVNRDMANAWQRRELDNEQSQSWLNRVFRQLLLALSALLALILGLKLTSDMI